MNILFTSKGNSWNSEFDPKFGRAAGFLLYDTEKMSSLIIQTKKIKNRIIEPAFKRVSKLTKLT